MKIRTLFAEYNLDDLDFGLGKKAPRLIKRDPFGDKDKDRMMNVTDCQPHNPRKQGVLGHAVGKYLRKRKGIIGRAAKSYAEYKKGAPERERLRIESLRRRAQIEEAKARIARARRIRTRPLPSMDYGRFFGLGAGVTPRAKPRKRKRKRKR